ncbi:MAG: cation:proton antiporter domain-containing protein [Alphaproteobacteria bacterium]
MLVLAVAGVVVPLFGRLQFGIVPGFLLAGLILGPGGLGRFVTEASWLSLVTFSEPEVVRPFAELGVLFLLFVIGLEFSFERLWSMRRLVFGVGSAQIILSVSAIVAVAMWFTATPAVALVIGLGFALSSTAIVTQVLIEGHRFATPVGRAALGVLLFQDLMVVPFVIVVGFLTGEEAGLTGQLIRAVPLGLAAIAAIIVAARYLVRPLIRAAAQTQSRELLVAIALFLVIGTALLTAAAGLSPALGAFLAGMLLGSSEYRHQIEVDIEPFKGLLLGLFFMTVGMTLHIVDLASHPFLLLGAVLALLTVKTIIAFLAAIVFRLPVPVALESALLLAGAGEFAFVLFSLAGDQAIFSDQLHQTVVSIAALSMLVTPLIGTLAHRWSQSLTRRAVEGRHGADSETVDLSDHVVIGGFGRVGRAVASILEAERIPYVALDLDAEAVGVHWRAGRNVFYGDASRREILERVGGARARSFVVTPNTAVAAARMVDAISHSWPGAVIHARATDTRHAEQLLRAGATQVVPEALESSLLLAGHVLTALGLAADAVEARLASQRELEISRVSADRREDAPAVSPEQASEPKKPDG